jgi:exopolysaccharide biosynthesis WecB/TagA/CpsF family protein
MEASHDGTAACHDNDRTIHRSMDGKPGTVPREALCLDAAEGWGGDTAAPVCPDIWAAPGGLPGLDLSCPPNTRSTGRAFAAGRQPVPVKRLLGLNLADMNAVSAAAWLAARPFGSPFGYVVTPNADHFVRLQRDPTLEAIYRGALLRLLDSRVVAGVGRAFGMGVPAVTTGSDLTDRLLRHHLEPGERITIVGLGAEHIATLVARHGWVTPAHYNPPMGFDHNPAEFAATIEFVLAHPARFVFLAVGSPRQERLAAAISATGRASGTGLCIGAGLAFLAGAERRAPAFVQRAGLEWLFRLGAHPRRLFVRYAVDCPPVFRLLLRERMNRPCDPE